MSPNDARKQQTSIHYYQTTEDHDKGAEQQVDREKMNTKRLHTLFFVEHTHAYIVACMLRFIVA